MSDTIRHSQTCMVQAGKAVEAVVHEFRPHEKLVVILNQSIKLPMKWNGKVYEGKMAGLDITSHGPTYNTIQKSVRG